MEFLSQIPAYALPFLVVLSVLVFVHELGHYLVARWYKVRVDVFSIGFGPELFGWNDRQGTRWKVSMVPLGGYVQMFGDADPASAVADDSLQEFSEEELAETFFAKPVGARAAIVAAGPMVNFIYAIIVLAGVFWVVGQPITPTWVGGLVEEGPAAAAGILPEDRIIAINGREINRFQEIQRAVTVALDTPLTFTVERGGTPPQKVEEADSQAEETASEASATAQELEQFDVTITPELIAHEDRFGFSHSVGRIGIISVGEVASTDHSLASAVQASFTETGSIITSTMTAIGQMITGVRSTDEIGGVIRIGAYAKEFSDSGFVALLMFSVMISINLGLINLFPIPLLDGGHLVFYAWEALAGKPMSEPVRNFGMRLGYGFIIILMVFATFNDLRQLDVFQFLIGLVS